MSHEEYTKEFRIRDFLFASWLIFEYKLHDLGLDYDNLDGSGKSFACWVIGLPTSVDLPCSDLDFLHDVYKKTSIAEIDELRRLKIKELRQRTRRSS